MQEIATIGLDIASRFFKFTGLMRRAGIVRVIGRELADRRSSRFSRGELTPFRECGSAVLLDDIAAVEVAVVVEVVVD